ncbi:MAG: ABC transporter ATP-binding protein [Lachnospiraceae bacterium]|nr:ABC transporter ATP-binding protein [Lachnospiraceae bacterium]
MDSILKLTDVGLSYHNMNGETSALHHISFSVAKGEFVSIVGPSGCGKSTLLSIIAGLLEPETGTIAFENPKGTIAYPKIGYMLQKDHLFEWRSIYKNILLGLEIQNKLDEAHLALVDDMLITYGLYKFKDKKPSELSGGMRQRAALIRTLALEPDILLLDEPFSALDYQTRLKVSDDIYCIIKKENKTAILVTHDLSEAISLGEKIIVLTKRPGTIKKIIPVTLSIKNRTPMESRNAPEFKDYFNLLWKELNS